jgi:C1A family cysteine protease
MIDRLGPDCMQLQSLGFESLEQVIGAAQVVNKELSRFLGKDIGQWLQPAAGLAQMPSAARQQQLAQLPRATGALIPDRPAAFEFPFPFPFPPVNQNNQPPPQPVQAQIDLRPQMPPIRNQGKRGTCAAFASLAVYEHFLGLNGSPQDLSEQFLYFECKQNDGSPTGRGTFIRVAFDQLDRVGCCPEADWPYNPDDIPGNEGEGPPPPGAQMHAGNFRIPSSNPIFAHSVDNIKQVLNAGRCVAFSIPVYNSWFLNQTVLDTGDITNPVPGESPNGQGHAMCMVGYTDLPGSTGLGGGRFILRNSWGETFGQAGYFTIPYSYIAQLAIEAFTIGQSAPIA